MELEDIVKLAWPFIPSAVTYCIGHYNGKAKSCVSDACKLSDEIKEQACDFWCKSAADIPSEDLQSQCHRIIRLLGSLSHKLNDLSRSSIFFCGTKEHVLWRVKDIRQIATREDFFSSERCSDTEKADLIYKKLLHLQTAIEKSYTPVPIKKTFVLLKKRLWKK
ncbi:MAG: hypothetical protein AB7S81_00115 [Bdellovibrionales bacterium]